MGPVVELRDRPTLAAFLRRDLALYAYHLGDLDDAFWPRSRWWGSLDAQGMLSEVLLLYAGVGTPTLLALSRDPSAMRELVVQVALELPSELYAHLSPGVLTAFNGWWGAPAGLHRKMRLVHPEEMESVEVHRAFPLGPDDRDELLEFYERVYPGNWFDPTMLETGCYAGLRAEGALVSVAGVHVVSREYSVAALGNIATAPEARGCGFARVVTAAVCRSLRANGIEEIGLNVHAANASATACYLGIGFEPCAEYEEHALQRAAIG